MRADSALVAAPAGLSNFDGYRRVVADRQPRTSCSAWASFLRIALAGLHCGVYGEGSGRVGLGLGSGRGGMRVARNDAIAVAQTESLAFALLRALARHNKTSHVLRLGFLCNSESVTRDHRLALRQRSAPRSSYTVKFTAGSIKETASRSHLLIMFLCATSVRFSSCALGMESSKHSSEEGYYPQRFVVKGLCES